MVAGVDMGDSDPGVHVRSSAAADASSKSFRVFLQC